MTDHTIPRGVAPVGIPYRVTMDGLLWGVAWAATPQEAADVARSSWLKKTGSRPGNVAVTPFLETEKPAWPTAQDDTTKPR